MGWRRFGEGEKLVVVVIRVRDVDRSRGIRRYAIFIMNFQAMMAILCDVVGNWVCSVGLRRRDVGC